MTFSPLALTPLIGVFDMPRAPAFYRDLLGFTVAAASPEVVTSERQFSHWMLLRFGGAEIMLNTQYDSNERPLRLPRYCNPCVLSHVKHRIAKSQAKERGFKGLKSPRQAKTNRT